MNTTQRNPYRNLFQRFAITSCLIAFTLPTTFCFAQGNTGNGDGLIYLNHVPTLADPFMKIANVDGQMILSPEMKKLLAAFETLLEARGFRVHDFFKKTVFSELNEYYYSTKLPCSDMHKGLTSDEEVHDTVCTENGITYALKDKVLSLSFLDQGLTLVHERLHARFPNAAHHWITGFITGLKRAVEIKAEQANGNFSPINSDKDLPLLKSMYLNAAKMGIPIEEGFNPDIDLEKKSITCKVYEFGGGVLCSDKLLTETSMKLQSNQVFIGIGSNLKIAFSHIPLNEDDFPFKIINNVFIDSSIAGSDLTIVNSKLNQVEMLKENYEPNFSKSWERWGINIENSQLNDITFSKLDNYDISYPNVSSQFSSIQNSSLEHCLISHSSITDSKAKDCSIANSKIVKSNIFTSELTLGSEITQSKLIQCKLQAAYMQDANCLNSNQLAAFGDPYYSGSGNKAFSLILEKGTRITNSNLNLKAWFYFPTKIILKENTRVNYLNIASERPMLRVTLNSPIQALNFSSNDKYAIDIGKGTHHHLTGIRSVFYPFKRHFQFQSVSDLEPFKQ